MSKYAMMLMTDETMVIIRFRLERSKDLIKFILKFYISFVVPHRLSWMDVTIAQMSSFAGIGCTNVVTIFGSPVNVI